MQGREMIEKRKLYEIKNAEASVVIWRKLKEKSYRGATGKLKKALNRYRRMCKNYHLSPIF